MLGTLRQHYLVRGWIEVVADATLYVLVMLVIIVLLGQLATLAI